MRIAEVLLLIALDTADVEVAQTERGQPGLRVFLNS
jgi:hypothetical protein